MTDDQTPDPRTTLSPLEVEAANLPDWRMLLSKLHGRFETGTFEKGVELVRAIGEAADELNHHPNVDLTYGHVDVRLTSHDVGGVTSRDVVLALTISDLALALGATPHPGQTSVLEVGLDTWDLEAVKPFWAALLGYEPTPGETRELDPDGLVDPDGTQPTIWFQRSEEHATPQQRWHFDLRLPPEEVEGRMAAALQAGGTLVSDAEAPAFWVLADAQGNQACLTTWQGREYA